MRSVFRVLCCFVVSSLLFLQFSCSDSKKEDTQTEKEQTAVSKGDWWIGENISFDWYLNIPWWQFNKEWTEYPVLKEVTEITGVTPIIKIPPADAQRKLDMMISANNLPDMVTVGLLDECMNKLIKSGQVYSYDELIEKYVPDFKNEIDKDVWNYTKADDNKLYGLPSFFITSERYQKKLGVGMYTYNIKKDYYKELGFPDMSNPDSFIEALKMFKKKYPEIGGKASIPFTLGDFNDNYIQIIERSFGVRDFYEDDKFNLKIKYKDPKYRNVISFLNRLYREGLMDPQNFVKKNEQVQGDLKSGRVFVYPTIFWTLDEVNSILEKSKQGSKFMATEPMEAVEDVSFPGINRLGWTITMVSRTAQNPEAVIKFIRFMWSKPGNLLVNYGHEGEHYTIRENRLIRTPNVADEWGRNLDGFSDRTGIYTFRFFYYDYYNNVAEADSSTGGDWVLADKYVYDNTVYVNKILPDPTTVEGEINNQIIAITKKELPKVIMSESEAAALLNLEKLIEKLNKYGLDKLEKYWTYRYKQNRENFQIK